MSANTAEGAGKYIAAIATLLDLWRKHVAELWEFVCKQCHGTGKVEEERTVEVPVRVMEQWLKELAAVEKVTKRYSEIKQKPDPLGWVWATAAVIQNQMQEILEKVKR